MKRSDVFGFTKRLAFCRRSSRGARRKVSLVASTVFFFLILPLFIMTGFPAISFGGTLTADFSMSATQGAAPLTVTFKDKSVPSCTESCPVDEWTWDFGDGKKGSGANPSHTYTEAGTYTVTLTVSDECAETDSKTRTITVTGPTEPPPPPPDPVHALTTANADCCNGTAPGDPVSSATGELYFSTSDLSLGSMYPGLSFSRYYASLLTDDGYVKSALGNNWMHNFDLKLLAGSTTATVVYHGGKIIEFEKSGSDWELKDPESIVFQLIEGDGHYHLFDPSTDLIYTFDYCQNLRVISNRNLKSLILTYSDDKLTQVADEFGRSLSFTYTSDKLTKVQDQSDRSISFSYTGDNLTGYTDARGNTTTYSYTSAGGLVGLMTSAILPEGTSLYTQTFDSDGRVKTQSDSSGNTVSLSYKTPTDDVTSMTDPLGYLIEHTHKDLKYLTKDKDQTGVSSSIAYDAGNRRSGVTDRLGNTTSVTYHTPSGKVASYTDAMGNTTTYSYTVQYKDELTYYNLTRIDYPDGTFVTMTNDWAGHVESLTDRSGKIWNYTYNILGQMLTLTNPAGGVTTYTHNADATRATRTDHLGNTTTFAYDPLKRLNKITHPDATFRSFTYDANDNTLTVTDERGKVTTFTYDTNDNLKTTTDPSGKTTTFAYDGHDRLISVVDKLGKTTSFTYDGLGRVGTTTNPASETFTFGYGPQGWLTSVTDPGGKTTSKTYDKEGVIASLTDALSNTWDYTSDKLGRITQETSPLSNTQSYTYDSMGRLTSYTNPLSKNTGYTYDSLGLLTGMTLPETISATYTRNDLGLITRITDPNGNPWDKAYDQMGQLTSRTDPLSNITSYTYDSRNRLSTVTFPESSLQLTYDGSDNVVRRLYSDGTDLQYTYDDNGRLLTADGLTLSYDARGGIIGSNGLAITGDDVGRIATMTLAAGKAVTYTYNSRGLVSQVSDWVGGSTTLTYDDDGRPSTITRPNGITTAYTYDQAGRLVGIVEQKGGTMSSVSLTRNGVGEITSAARNVPLMPDPAAGTQSFTYDAASRISGYTYDKMGRLTADGTRTYTWDLASRLTSYTEGGSTVSFTYDGKSMRTGRTQGGTTRNYIWNYALSLPSVSVVREGGSDIRYHIHLPDGRLLHSIEASDNTRRFFHYDEMGTTLYLTNGAGTITDSYGISPYGQFTAKTGTTENPFTFIGAYGVMQEGTTGLYYMRARYYDSHSQQFLTEDPVRAIEPRSLSPYQYAQGNPMRFIDPHGMLSWADVKGWFKRNIYNPTPPEPEWRHGPRGKHQGGCPFLASAKAAASEIWNFIRYPFGRVYRVGRPVPWENDHSPHIWLLGQDHRPPGMPDPVTCPDCGWAPTAEFMLEFWALERGIGPKFDYYELK